MFVSPSLDGILRHDSVSYEGVVRPEEVLRVLDGPASKGQPKEKEGEEKREDKMSKESRVILERYLHDLYGIFMKNMAHFVIGSGADPSETVKLQAMFQEMVKIKGLLTESERPK